VFTAGGDPAPEIIDEPDNLLYDRPAILINGEIWERGRDGDKIGHFERVLFPEEGIVEHAMLSLLPEYKGDGTGGDFLLETEEMYRRAGFKKIKLLAGLDDGPYVWAAKGFDWFKEKERTRFLDVLELEAELDQERLDFDEEPVYFESAEEIREMLRLIQAARNQEFDDEDRIRPFDFTFSDGVRKILTDPQVKGRSWVGIKNL
jgi:GNAT superfamily N-acetyltransferase